MLNHSFEELLKDKEYGDCLLKDSRLYDGDTEEPALQSSARVTGSPPAAA
jgi:hypothetical protein